MGLFDKIKDIMTDEEDDFDDYNEGRDSFVKPPRRRERDIDPPLHEKEERTERTSKFSRSDKVVNIHTTAKLQVVLAKPERFEDAKEIADHLNEKRTVVLNLEGTNKEVARRLIDLLNGVAYANGGQLKKVANNTFIITPYNVDVTGDLIDELENTGVFF